MDVQTARQMIGTIFNHKDRGIRVRYWDGTTEAYGKGDIVTDVTIKSPSFFDQLLKEPSLGFGEAYMRGDIDVEGDLGALIEMAYEEDIFKRLSPANKARLCWFKFKGKHSINHCKRDVQSHYDRGNDFYRLWLDKDMNYSCAYFKDPEDTLEQAQLNKNLHTLKKLRLKKGERLLDIGCGWSALIRLASKRFGAKAVGLTLSHGQKSLGDEFIKREGLENLCEVRLMDYRELPKSEVGSYDKVVSVGMFEHVGKEKYGVFFKKVYSYLNDNGLFLLHTISRMKPKDTDPWICTYIFPGGYIPSIGQVLEAAFDAGFRLVDIEDLRRHYDLTLGHWLRRFEKVRARIKEMKGEEFVRMWRLYLIGSQMSFRSGNMYVSQFLFSKNANIDLPLTRMWMHSEGI